MNGLAHRHTDRQLLISYIMSSATELKKTVAVWNGEVLEVMSANRCIVLRTQCSVHDHNHWWLRQTPTMALPPSHLQLLVSSRPGRYACTSYLIAVPGVPRTHLLYRIIRAPCERRSADWRCSRMLEKSTNKKLAWLNWTYYSLHLKSSSQNRSRWRQPEETAVPLSSLKGTWWWRWRWWRQENNSVLYRVSLWLLADCIFFIFYASDWLPPLEQCWRHSVFGLSVRACVRAWSHTKTISYKPLVGISSNLSFLSSWEHK